MFLTFPWLHFTSGYSFLQYPWVTYFCENTLDNQGMDKYEKRRQALSALINDKYHGVAASFARAVGMDSSYVTRMLYPEGKAGRKRIGEDTVEKISAVHPVWLSGIEHVNQANSLHSGYPAKSNISETTIPLRGRVPLISLVAAGNWSESVDNFHPGDADIWIATTIQVKQHTYAVRVSGDSMEPKFPDGAIIIVEPDEVARNGSYVIVRQNGSDATFKQLVIDGGQKYLKPLNDRYPIMQMHPDATLCGVVKQMVMDV